MIFTDQAKKLLEKFYVGKEEKIEEMFSSACSAYSGGDKELEKRLRFYIENNYMCFSSPMLSNSPREANTNKRSLPISCYISYVGDTIELLNAHIVETRYLAISGGGVGCDWSVVRSSSEKSSGIVPFLHTLDADVTAYRQGKTRKGSYAAYLDTTHPELLEFCNMRAPGNDLKRRNPNLHHGVNLSDKFMEALETNAMWELIDPHTKKVTRTLRARDIWGEILTLRSKTGEPYLNFIDTVNRSMNEELREKGLKIISSNLCNEIHLPSSEDRTAVCCISSLNLEHYDEWKDTTLVEDMITMLDNALEVFLERAPQELWKAKESVKDYRAIGFGSSGLFSLFRKNKIDPESKAAAELNKEIFSLIKKRAQIQSEKLGRERGFPRLLSKQRNSDLLAIAPNSNTSIIMGGSPGIEPFIANVFTHRTRAGSDFIVEKYFRQLLEEKGKMSEEIIGSVMSNNGSVAHLDFLSEHEKKVFKTAFEIDQNVLLDLASDRQKFICQGQSLNLFTLPGESKKRFSELHLSAWKKGLKGLYYLRTQPEFKAAIVRKEYLSDVDCSCKN